MLTDAKVVLKNMALLVHKFGKDFFYQNLVWLF